MSVFFGLRFDLRNPPFAGVDMADRYAALLDMVEWADERGALYVTLSEHHGSDDGYLPSPLTMAAAIAARTRNVRIMIAALIAPFYDPLRLAEDAAVVDLISGGRLDLIVAGGYRPEEFEMFGVAPSDRAARVHETVETLKRAWTGEPLEFRGRTVRVLPTPVQPGGPRITLGGTSDAAARRAARIADGFIPSEPQYWDAYREECLKLEKPDPGPCPIGMNSVVVLAEDPERAWPLLGPYFLHEVSAYGAWEAAAGHGRYIPVADVDELRAKGEYRILTPDEYRRELGDAGYVMLHPMVGGIPPKLAWEHLQLFEEAFLR